MEEIISIRKFNEINIKDTFFDSLIEDYPEFPKWFQRKSQCDADAYVQYKEDGTKYYIYLTVKYLSFSLGHYKENF